MSIIKTEHLTHIYSQGTPYERAALQDFNIEIEEGEFAGIIGHTGSGKSTFIQHLNGLLAPTEGKVYIDGEDLWADKKDLRRFRFKVGWCSSTRSTSSLARRWRRMWPSAPPIWGCPPRRWKSG